MTLLTFSLSLRKESFNRKLIGLATQLSKEAGIKTENLDLLDYDMPTYNQDVQDKEGFPESAERFKEKLEQANALIISSPEYNFSYPGHFKNTFDWLSRYQPMPWSNKAVLFLSASPSLVGANRGLWQLRIPFEACGAFVFPTMFSLASAHQAFNEEKQLIDQGMFERLSKTVNSFIRFSQSLKY